MKMIEKKIGVYGVLTGFLHEYNRALPNIEAYPAVLILPGGGFRVCSYREAEPVAMAYYAEGYQAFVLNYTVTSVKPDAVIDDPMNDVNAALDYIRENRVPLLVAEGKLAMVGFSGGGHLAAAVATHGPSRPDALLLGYPGILPSNLRSLSCGDILERVDARTPPAFLFSMHGDTVTPPKHLLSFACALEEHDIPFELHIFHGKGHGLSLGTSLTCAGFASDINSGYSAWFTMSVQWLRDRFGDFTIYGINDGRQGRLSIDSTVAALFSNEQAKEICMNHMPALEKFSNGASAEEFTPRRINGFMPVLTESALTAFDHALLSL